MKSKYLLSYSAALALLGGTVAGVELSFPVANANAKQVWSEKAAGAPVVELPDAQKLNQAFTQLAKNLSPAVVSISVKSKAVQHDPRSSGNRGAHPFGGGLEEFFHNDQTPFGPGLQPPGSLPPQAGMGSGFVISKDGYIVTNAHVVRTAGKNVDEILVRFLDEDESSAVPAKVVGVDDATDVALIKLEKPKANLSIAPLGDSDKAAVGEWVVAIGNPYGHSNTLTQGVVSGKFRDLPGMRSDFLQTSAGINPGNSGGPLINMNGEVIGINTAIDPRAQSIGFAIPINSAKNVISQLMTDGKVNRGYLGIAIRNIDEEIKGYMHLENTTGVLVREVVPGEAAQSAGVKAYDIIVGVDEKPVKNSKELLRALDAKKPGEKVSLEVVREKKPLKISVMLKAPSEPQT